MKIFSGQNSKYIKLTLSLIATYIIIKLLEYTPALLGKISDLYAILGPFIIAFIIAYALNPIVNLIMKKTNLSRNLSITLTYILFISMIGLISFYIFPGLYSTTKDLIEALPGITSNAQNMIDKIILQINSNPDLAKSLSTVDFNTIIASTSKLFNSLLSQTLTGAISLTTSVVNMIFGFLISIYILIDKDKFINFTRKATLTLFGRNIGLEIINFIKILNINLGSYIGIKAIDSTIIGFIAIIGLSVLGTKYALLLAVIVGFTNMIPYFGPFIGMFVTFLVNLFAGDFKLALISTIFLFFLQQFDAWYLDPKLIGNKIGLSPFVVILAVTIGGAIYGPLGMIVATPIASVINFYVNKALQKYSYRMNKPKKETNNTKTIKK
ncbi:AI-2E family transporter [Clostridium massiliamazoniense]|uniref:AI-2E family transporter n=1 Tax=Clostridium massiliamazoniense TaxID=1347366 RepID=UPI0006D7FD24|nr:AI-2E family transporter [Clostridium massiliamazoniense]